MDRILAFSLLLCFYCCRLVVATEDVDAFAPVVEITAGKVRGLVHTLNHLDDEQIYLYKGIRFATANRFEKPKLLKSFDVDVYEATKDGNSCPQFVDVWDMDRLYKTNHSEDCLFLNVYKPIMESQDEPLLPVMFWIYGGGFQTGTIFSPIYDCSNVAALGKVIVVSVNYRLGPLGFLSAGTEDAPGNQGLYDQLMGLEWVRDNIQAFGGDPQQVTIFGVSAGSISVSALVLSPLAKGLFKRAILQSGAISPNFIIPNPGQNLERTMKFAAKLNCANKDKRIMLDCLRSKSLEELKLTGNLLLSDLFSDKGFFPIIGDEFLPDTSARFENGFNEVDMIYGVTRNEGGMFAIMVAPELSDDNSQLTKERVEQIILEMMDRFKLDESRKIVDFYTKNLDATDLNQVRKALMDFFGDHQLTCPTMLFAKHLAKRSEHEHHYYAYRFDRRSPMINMMNCVEWMGVCHGAEIFYMLGSPALKMSPEDWKLSQEMINAWTMFAKTGTPGSVGSAQWEEAFSDGDGPEKVISLDLESKMISNPFHDSCDGLWERIFAKHLHWKMHSKEEL